MVIPAAKRAQPRRKKSVSRWAIGIGLLALLAIAGIVVGLLALGGSNNDNPPAASKRVQIAGVTSYDPYGDNKAENSAAAINATDRNQATYWSTESYNDAPSLNKPGVGLVLDAGRPVRPTALTLETDQPGFEAEVRAGSSPTGPFTAISNTAATSDTTVYRLRAPSPERYILLWITKIPDGSAADVNELRLR
jgi:hypothetical protein